MNWRAKFSWEPFKITADFWSCSGISLGRLTVEAKKLPFLCCGLLFDASLTFSRCRGFEKLTLTINDLPFLCCGITTKIKAEFTPTAKTVKLEPSWPGISGCFAVYGRVDFRDNTLDGLEVYGWDINCYIGNIKLRAITAFNPEKMGRITDITFRRGEWQYLSLGYATPGCCGDELTLSLKTWFGDRGILFDIQRFRFELEVPLVAKISVFSNAQWDFANPAPLDWFNIGWKLSF